MGKLTVEDVVDAEYELKDNVYCSSGTIREINCGGSKCYLTNKIDKYGNRFRCVECCGYISDSD